MNAERLNVIAQTIYAEMETTRVVDSLESTINSLQELVNQSHPEYQKQLADNLKKLYVALSNTETDQFSPAWRQTLAEIGGSDLVGSKLKSQVEQILQHNQITLAVALEELRALLKRLKEFRDALRNLVGALEHLNIGQEELSPGECEVGVMVPRVAIHNDLGEFADEIHEVMFILNTLSEIATGSKEHFKIRTLSSSDPTFYLSVLPPLAACVAVCVERIVALYKQLLEIRKLQNELKNQGVPEGQTAGIEEHANSLMAKGIEELSVEILQQFHRGKDKGRKNELHNGLRISLNKIANRVDKGYHIEVRCEPLRKEDQEKSESKETAIHLAKVQSASVQLQFFKLEGSPILRLPEGSPKSKGDKKAAA